MHVQLLGDLQVSHERLQLALGGHRQRCVLAVLLLDPGQVIPTERIVAHAWPPDPPDTASDLVTSYVSRLRKALKEVSDHIELVNQRPGYLAKIDPGLVDVHRFSHLVRQARSDRDALDPERAALRLHEALGLWHGTALADLTSPWLDGQRSRLEQLRLDALEDFAEIELQADRADQVAGELRELSRAHPHRERLTVLAIRALDAVGEPSQAADVAFQAIRSLRRHGLDPSPALQQAQLAALRSGSHPSSSRPGTGRVQLPADTPAFTGRTSELAGLSALFDDKRVSETALTCAIDGMPGIGKTAFAVHAAHLLAERFPDGQLFIDLHGFTPDTAPTKPEIALDRLLRAMGTATHQIPLEIDERATLFRQRLATTRTLIILDNAASEAQVRPLLPGSPGCLVLVTSRRHLTGLDDAHTITLGALPDAEATALFTAIVGPGRVSGSDPALAQTIALCANVPLTLRIAAARLHNRPTWPLRYLAARLHDQTQRLAQLDDGDRSLAAALSVSYEHLTGEEQRLFRHLGLHPGTDIDLYATAALIDTTTATAELLLEGLVDHNLLAQPSTGRYQLHDLIRLHARDLASTAAPDAQNTAVEHLLNYYLHTARRADRLLSRQSVNHTPPEARKPAASPTFTTDAHAITWMEAERINFTAIVDHCDQSGLSMYVITMSDAMHTALHIQGHWPLAERLQQAALATAQSLGDFKAQANALCHIGDIMLLTGRCPQAIEVSGRALRLYRGIGDRVGEANACCTLAQAQRLTSHFSQAVEALERALALYSDLGDWLGEATARTTLGSVQKLAGQYPEAEANLETAYSLCARFGHRYGQAAALADLGEVQQLTGQYFKAVKTLYRALDFYRYLGNRLGEASVLTCVGEIRRLLKQYSKAERLLGRALELHRQLGNRLGQAEALTSLGIIQNARGDSAESHATLQQAYLLYRALDNQLGLSDALFALADVQRDMGRHEDADSNRHLALNILQEIEKDR
jgi:DNA-binding SARP family transcriptional activator/tetratricopeptide (TPR) repeat protein